MKEKEEEEEEEEEGLSKEAQNGGRQKQYLCVFKNGKDQQFNGRDSHTQTCTHT